MKKAKHRLILFLSVVLAVFLWFGVQHFMLGMLRLFDSDHILPFNLIDSFPYSTRYFTSLFVAIQAYFMVNGIMHWRTSRGHWNFYRGTRTMFPALLVFIQLGITGTILFPLLWLHEDPSLFGLVDVILGLSIVWILMDAVDFRKKKQCEKPSQTGLKLLALVGISLVLFFVEIPGLTQLKQEIKAKPYYHFQSQRVKLNHASKTYLRAKNGPVFNIQIRCKQDETLAISDWNGNHFSSATNCLDEFSSEIYPPFGFNCFWESDSTLSWRECGDIIDALRSKNAIRNIIWSARPYWNSSYQSDYPLGMRQWLFPLPQNAKDSLNLQRRFRDDFYPIFLNISEDKKRIADIFRGDLAAALSRSTTIFVGLNIPDSMPLHTYLHVLDELYTIEDLLMAAYPDHAKSVSFVFKPDLELIQEMRWMQESQHRHSSSSPAQSTPN